MVEILRFDKQLSDIRGKAASPPPKKKLFRLVCACHRFLRSLSPKLEPARSCNRLEEFIQTQDTSRNSTRISESDCIHASKAIEVRDFAKFVGVSHYSMRFVTKTAYQMNFLKRGCFKQPRDTSGNSTRISESHILVSFDMFSQPRHSEYYQF